MSYVVPLNTPLNIQQPQTDPSGSNIQNMSLAYLIAWCGATSSDLAKQTEVQEEEQVLAGIFAQNMEKAMSNASQEGKNQYTAAADYIQNYIKEHGYGSLNPYEAQVLVSLSQAADQLKQLQEQVDQCNSEMESLEKELKKLTHDLSHESFWDEIGDAFGGNHAGHLKDKINKIGNELKKISLELSKLQSSEADLFATTQSTTSMNGNMMETKASAVVNQMDSFIESTMSSVDNLLP